MPLVVGAGGSMVEAPGPVLLMVFIEGVVGVNIDGMVEGLGINFRLKGMNVEEEDVI